MVHIFKIWLIEPVFHQISFSKSSNVLVHLGCYNKISDRVTCTQENFLTLLEARKSKIEVPEGQVKAFFLVHSWHFFLSHMVGDFKGLPGIFFKGTY